MKTSRAKVRAKQATWTAEGVMLVALTACASAPDEQTSARDEQKSVPRDGDVVFEEELTEEELAAFRRSDSDDAGQSISRCIWEDYPTTAPQPPGPPELEGLTAPTIEEKIALAEAAMAFVRDQLPAAHDVELLWTTRGQDALSSDSVESFVDPSDAVAETLSIAVESIAVEPFDKVIVHRCGMTAFVPVQFSLRSSMTGIDSTGTGFISYPDGWIGPSIDSNVLIDLRDADGQKTHVVRMKWDELTETWTGNLRPADYESLRSGDDEEDDDDDAPEREPVSDPEGLSRAHFPAACGGFDQVPVSESGGFVAAADLQRYTNDLGPMQVDFPGLGATQLSLSVSKLLSETTCIESGGGTFAARVELAHESGARHEVEYILDYYACTEPGLLEPFPRTDSCVHFEPRVRLELIPGDEFATAIASDLDLELIDDEDNPYSMFCEFSLAITKDGIDSTDGSLCRLWTETETDGTWQFEQ